MVVLHYLTSAARRRMPARCQTRYGDTTHHAHGCDDRLVVTPSRHRRRPQTFTSSRSARTSQRSPACSPSIPSPPGDGWSRWRTLGQTCSRGDPGSAICVQRLDDSLNSAIHTRYRSLLRSSSMHEPRDPPSEVVKFFHTLRTQRNTKNV